MSNLENEHDDLDMTNLRKRVTWDETTISEHDKDRGTRTVINEPKTPYNGLGIPEDPSVKPIDNREELLNRLVQLNDSIKSRKVTHVAFSEENINDGIHNNGEDSVNHEDFLMKRKNHYNEYQVVLKMREEMEIEEKSSSEDEYSEEEEE